MRHIDLLKRNAMLDGLRRQSFEYFVHEANPNNGLIADKTAPDWPASIAAMGMALTVYPIGSRHGYITYGEGLQRTLVMLRFLWNAEQGDATTACGHHGFFYHFLHMESGARAWNCELSSIDTALLMAGVLAAAAFFRGDTKEETEVRSLADSLYRRVDWDWMRNGGRTLCHGWRPESGFLPWHWEGYDEALILYVLALGSPTHPISPDCYAAWAESYEWKTVEGVEYLHAGPLFIHQISHAWIDFRGLRDNFMRKHDSDYFENSCRAVQVQQRYAMRNPGRFDMYGELCWGITASDGPGGLNRHPASTPRLYYDYIARGVPEGPDDGTLAPWAVVASLPFAPEIVLPTIQNYLKLQLHVANPYGFKASFNATFTADRRHPVGWVSPFHFGINEGPTVIMIENFEAGTVWRLMRSIPYIAQGLRNAGFRGGWLGEYA